PERVDADRVAPDARPEADRAVPDRPEADRAPPDERLAALRLVPADRELVPEARVRDVDRAPLADAERELLRGVDRLVRPAPLRAAVCTAAAAPVATWGAGIDNCSAIPPSCLIRFSTSRACCLVSLRCACRRFL